MSVYRARAARRGVSIPASALAKWKTFVQDWAIAFCVIPLTAHHLVIGVTTIWVAVGHDALHRLAVLPRRKQGGLRAR